MSFDRVFMCAAASVALGTIGWLDANHLPGLDPVFLVGSLGATAVIVFGTPESPMASPRSVFGGHLVSALIGVSCFRLLGDTPWLAGALAVAFSMIAMHHTRTLHAPGGATALIANIGSAKVHALGYGYAVAPVLSGVVVIMTTALLARLLQRGARRARATARSARRRGSFGRRARVGVGVAAAPDRDSMSASTPGAPSAAE